MTTGRITMSTAPPQPHKKIKGVMKVVWRKTRWQVDRTTREVVVTQRMTNHNIKLTTIEKYLEAIHLITISNHVATQTPTTPHQKMSDLYAVHRMHR